MFRPIAVAAKIRIWVAIDMFASEPCWVNGNRNATTKAARMSTLRCRSETPVIQAITPVRNRIAMKPQAAARKETKEPPSLWFSAKAAPNSASAIKMAIARISIHGLATAFARVGGRSGTRKRVPPNDQHRSRPGRSSRRTRR